MVNMKAYAIHTVHHTDTETGKVVAAPAKSIIQNISKEDFDELLKLGAVRKPTKGEVADGSDEEHDDEDAPKPKPKPKPKAGEPAAGGAETQSGGASESGGTDNDSQAGASGQDILG